MAAGQRLRIVVEYYERGGQAVMALRWRTPGAATFTPIPANRLYLP
jgi:MSHA biogenesis protein MshQ